MHHIFDEDKFQNQVLEIRNFYESAPERCHDLCLSDACTDSEKMFAGRKTILEGFCGVLIWSHEQNISAVTAVWDAFYGVFNVRTCRVLLLRFDIVCECDHLERLKSSRFCLHPVGHFPESVQSAEETQNIISGADSKILEFCSKGFYHCFYWNYNATKVLIIKVMHI